MAAEVVVGNRRKWESAHMYRGADITPVFWSARAEERATREQVADYLWRESGKWAQKTPPDGFGGLAFYGRWGKAQRFEPVEGAREIDARVFFELRRVYVGLVRSRIGKRFRGPRGNDGLTVFDVPEAPVLAGRLEEWARAEVTRKMMAAYPRVGE